MSTRDTILVTGGAGLQMSEAAFRLQLRMTEPEKAWLACAIDGEGYIYVVDTIDKHEGWKLRRVNIGVCNTDLNFLAEAGRLLGSTKLYEQRGTSKTDRKKRCYQVRQLDRFKAAAILKEILPYLIIKKEKALAGIRLVEQTDWSRQYSDDQLLRRSERMKALWDSGTFTGALGKRWRKRAK